MRQPGVDDLGQIADAVVLSTVAFRIDTGAMSFPGEFGERIYGCSLYVEPDDLMPAS